MLSVRWQVERQSLHIFFYADTMLLSVVWAEITSIESPIIPLVLRYVTSHLRASTELPLKPYPISSACRCIRGTARTRLRNLLFHILRQSFNLPIPRLRLRVHDNMALLPTTASPSQNGNSSRAHQSVTNRVPVIFRRLLKFHQMVWVGLLFI